MYRTWCERNGFRPAHCPPCHRPVAAGDAATRRINNANFGKEVKRVFKKVERGHGRDGMYRTRVYKVTSERKSTKRQMAVIDEATSAVRNAG